MPNSKKRNYVLKPTKLFLIIAIVMLIIGAGVTAGFSAYLGARQAKIKKYVVTTGTVIDYEITYKKTNRHGTKEKFYAEIAEFEVDSVTYTAVNDISVTYGVKDIGDSVEIAYNPDHPADCIFVTKSNTFGLTIPIILGVIFICAGTGLLIYYLKDYKAWKAYQAELTANTP